MLYNEHKTLSTVLKSYLIENKDDFEVNKLWEYYNSLPNSDYDCECGKYEACEMHNKQYEQLKKALNSSQLLNIVSTNVVVQALALIPTNTSQHLLRVKSYYCSKFNIVSDDCTLGNPCLIPRTMIAEDEILSIFYNINSLYVTLLTNHNSDKILNTLFSTMLFSDYFNKEELMEVYKKIEDIHDDILMATHQVTVAKLLETNLDLKLTDLELTHLLNNGGINNKMLPKEIQLKYFPTVSIEDIKPSAQLFNSLTESIKEISHIMVSTKSVYN